MNRYELTEDGLPYMKGPIMKADDYGEWVRYDDVFADDSLMKPGHPNRQEIKDTIGLLYEEGGDENVIDMLKRLSEIAPPREEVES